MSHREIILSDGTCARISGAGPALVFLHGVGLNQSIWAEQVKAFAPTHRVITYDLLGHGHSAHALVNANLNSWVLQLESLVDELNLDSFTLAGFSFGGMIAQAFAAKHENLLEKLVLMSTVHDRTQLQRASILARLELAEREGPNAIIGAALARWFSPTFAAANPEVMQGYDRLLRSNHAGSFLAAYKCFVNGDKELVGVLSALKCPTLVMTGKHDMGSTPAMAERLARTIPAAECSIVARGWHMIPVERAADVNFLLRQFIERPRP